MELCSNTLHLGEPASVTPREEALPDGAIRGSSEMLELAWGSTGREEVVTESFGARSDAISARRRA